MKVEIEVTQDDIEKGRKNSSSSCAVALAVKRQGYVHPYVDGENIMFSCPDTDKRFTSNCTKRVTHWIGNFDEDKRVKPFRFTLNYSELSKLG